MTKKVIIDSNGLPLEFYETDIHNISMIPAAAISINEADYIELSTNPNNRIWNDTLSVVENYDNISELSNYISLKLEFIDLICEQQRGKYITKGSGQSLTYQEKSEEATDFIAAGSPVDLTPYPFIQAEVNATGKTAIIASNDILTAQSLWITKGSLIEQHRIKAKLDISTATDISSVDSIVTSAAIAIELV